jgi:hypothetical protein
VRSIKKQEARDLKVGDPITCVNAVEAFYSRYAGNPACLFGPGDVGVVASKKRNCPRGILVDFYKKTVARCSNERLHLWRASLALANVESVSRSEAEHHLKRNAPSWNDYLDEIVALYASSYFEGVKQGVCPPYPNYAAHEELVPFLQLFPSQQELQIFAETFRQKYAWTGKNVQEMATTLVVANKYLSEIRIPWTYDVG